MERQKLGGDGTYMSKIDTRPKVKVHVDINGEMEEWHFDSKDLEKVINLLEELKDSASSIFY